MIAETNTPNGTGLTDGSVARPTEPPAPARKRKFFVPALLAVLLVVAAATAFWALLPRVSSPGTPQTGLVVRVTGTPGLAFSGGITYPDGSYRHVGETVPWSSSPFPCDSGQLTVGFEKQGTGAMTVDFILNGTVVKSANRGPADSSGLLIAYAC